MASYGRDGHVPALVSHHRCVFALNAEGHRTNLDVELFNHAQSYTEETAASSAALLGPALRT